ncbi:PepSY-like domain-containing protein [Prevotella sp. 10(H)]|uniref:PepSY-like domain-containing protein n=1 Tax=Prevotella sp. 10(H) TaxID=1158294 RepID=UPI0004A6D664|nr:PepSY-like domain-containing protein [Prevotella sp. 10(H)]
MKQKLVFTLIFSLITFFSACSDDNEDEKSFPYNKLPTDARIFIEKHFPNSTVQNIDVDNGEYDKYAEYDKYTVKLSGDVTATFNKFGFWRMVECPNGIATDKEILWPRFYDDLKKIQPNVKVLKYQLYDYGYRVYLNNDVVIATAHDRIEGYDVTGKKPLPQKISTFITDHFKGEKIEYVVELFKKDKLELSGYLQVGFAGGSTVSFNGDNWYQSGGTVSDALLKTLPKTVSDALYERYKEPKIQTLKKYETYCKITVSNDRGAELLIDYESGIIEPPTKVVEDFIKKYISEKVGAISPVRQTDNPKRIIFRYTFRADVGNCFLQVDKKGDWVECHLSGEVLPDKLTALLPASVLKYVADNYPDNKIFRIGHNYEGEYLVMPELKVSLKFDKDGKFIEKGTGFESE